MVDVCYWTVGGWRECEAFYSRKNQTIARDKVPKPAPFADHKVASWAEVPRVGDELDFYPKARLDRSSRVVRVLRRYRSTVAHVIVERVRPNSSEERAWALADAVMRLRALPMVKAGPPYLEVTNEWFALRKAHDAFVGRGDD